MSEPNMMRPRQRSRKSPSSLGSCLLNSRIIHFVADLPVRVEDFGATPDDKYGHVVFVLTEFQLADKQTAQENELGDNNHTSYKFRQHDRVRQRLMRGSKGPTLRLRSIDSDDPA